MFMCGCECGGCCGGLWELECVFYDVLIWMTAEGYVLTGFLQSRGGGGVCCAPAAKDSG